MHIFISYAKDETRDLAVQLRDMLASLPDVTAWMDESLRPGRNWVVDIQAEIRRCDCVGVMLSPDVNRDPNGEKGISFVINEIGYAQQLHKRIIPVMAQTTHLPLQIVSLQYIDFTSDHAAGIQQLIQEISLHRGETSPSGSYVDSQSIPCAQYLLMALLVIFVAWGILRFVPQFSITFPPPPPPNANQFTSVPSLATLVFAGVSRNADWSPVYQTFNSIEMALIPAGCFMMGGEDGTDDEKPVHQQCFYQPFWIDRTEVTRGQYAACVVAAACTETPVSRYSTRDTQPINRVTWLQAWDHCAWRDARLPTEREWEYAARGPDNLTYPWGDEFVTDNVLYAANSGNDTADVGSSPAGVSWVGALDMSGNVGEWVSSRYASYPYDPADGRESNGAESEYILRGGDYFSLGPTRLRATARSKVDPSREYNIGGFRCARDFIPADLSG